MLKGNLMDSLNVPSSRLNEGATMVLGNQDGEISRDEHKFNQFIIRLRRRFTNFFKELLKRQLILKGITTEEDWDEVIDPYLKFLYTADDFQAEQRQIDQFASRIQTLAMIRDAQIIGTVFSKDTVMSKVFGWTEEDAQEEQKKIDKEIADGVYPDPKKIEEEDRKIEIANAMPTPPAK